MRAVTWAGPGRVEVRDVDEPSLQDDRDVLVDVDLTAVCGSDLHLFHGDIPLEPGDVMGHEFVGTVAAVGDDVTHVAEGDAVVGSFQAPCGTCVACRKGHHHACEDLWVFGYGPAFGDLPGTQAEQVRVPRADLALRPLPDGVSPEEAIFACDTLTAAYTGVRPHLGEGDVVAVVGCGPVGLCSIEVAKALGAGRIFAVDLDPRRLDVAKDRGAVALDPDEADPAARLAEATDGAKADLVVEAVGGEGQGLATAFDLVGPGGHVAGLGVPTAFEVPYDWLRAFTMGIGFTPTLANVPRWIDEVLELQAAGRLSVAWMVSHRMGLDEAGKAYELFDEREALKVLLEP